MALPPAPTDTTANRLKVFLSYSRRDASFAQELLTALELLGFDAYLDKEDIAPGEPWEARLGALIQMADTVVFVLSPNSLASKHCAWEVEETARVSKRLVPVMLRQDPDMKVPERLSRLNYVFFNEGQSFSKGLGDLARPLRADVGWIREHTRYGDQAVRWIERGRPEALLLRGSDLTDAERWMAERPKAAPEISANQQAFVAASRRAAEAEQAAKARLRWRVQIGLAAASVVLAGLAAFSGVQWQVAEKAKGSLAASNSKLAATVGELERAQSTLATQNAELAAGKAELAASNAKLQRRLALRTAPLGNEPINVPAGWFQVATTYAGAVGFVEKRGESGDLIASGVIVDAQRLDPRWASRPVFVTATFVLSRTGGASGLPLDPEHALMSIFGPDGVRVAIPIGEILWQSEETGVTVAGVSGTLPAWAPMLGRIAEAFPEGLAAIPRAKVGDLFDAAGVLRTPSGLHPIVFVGYHHDRREVALSVSHLLGRISGGDPGESIPQFARAARPATTDGRLREDMAYIHVTQAGASGAPVFDAASGELIGIHLTGIPCTSPSEAVAQRRCWGGSTSMARVVAAIRAEPAGR